ncbi:hypothetical protein [Klebsiella phage ZCKP8]|uniref:hypothetical protein n=1 Tax=Klebsiella phage vB_Kpn_ZCKp20p TaxID=2981580 RepID=UPI001CE596B6|nr:hypothetical protein PRB86_gp37 [Klebsiella phage vB_Kpn_ZCKp20p]YP_010685614.1 hypothetical protein PRB87_gp36 [Klebsiella phage ZCKP8]YP_010685691.1 hypothetical protein PRB88_gp29 [Klebsiella phage vB_Kpn_ZC2]YP_010686076.1 hypothetical protein PRB93_gp25 [Klebsiella phage 6991]QYW02901.1 hypothetical protein [Klebsiella phage ZCKP8]URY99559.1 hypothetical protein 6991_0025 [Klebsiella phage 6991]UXQ88418.1 hypothetical protein [Klebsiella phage vB_Kpn_ZCKp20p]UZN98662.1 hypothetical p
MSKASTLLQLIMADIREDNARARWQKNQPDRRTLKQMLHTKCRRPGIKRDYRRDRVLRKLCSIQVKYMMEKVAK